MLILHRMICPPVNLKLVLWQCLRS